MRRILLLNTDLEVGGTPTVIRELAIRIRGASDAHLEVACLARRGPVAEPIEKAGIEVTPLNAAGVMDVGVVPRLVRLIRGHRIDTVFSFLVHANAMAAVASRACREVRFIQAIQTTQPRPRWHWPVQAAAQYGAEKIVVPSESVASAARGRAGVPAEKIVVIANAIDASAFHLKPEARPAADAPLGGNAVPANGRLQIGFIGRLDPVKRVPDLLLAMQSVGLAHLHIFGSGEQRPLLEEMIERLGIAGRVTLRGPSAGPAEALRQIDLLVLPSEAEGFPLVLIEGMAAGVPIVATNAPGIRDVIQHEQTGLLVPVGAPAELASAINSLAGDPARRRSLAASAYLDVLRRFTWDRVLPQYLHLLGLNAKN